ncbi:hypothetical protein U9M48_032866 [Paspalum notatum var. saurae]|uniref:Uncharacterized protein n=1 Tax=Paspalum notatum var. saurae TaxID=547442 RepID=A0AAQ3U841_PASNO
MEQRQGLEAGLRRLLGLGGRRLVLRHGWRGADGRAEAPEWEETAEQRPDHMDSRFSGEPLVRKSMFEPSVLLLF